MIKIPRGLDIPISGVPSQKIESVVGIKQVGLVADFCGLKPSMKVAVGDQVKPGDILFNDKANPKVNFITTHGGTVTNIHRNQKRKLQSVVIEVDEVKPKKIDKVNRSDLNKTIVKKILLSSGEWVAIRSRPFGAVANPDNQPKAIFITAMDTNPLAPTANIIIANYEKEFLMGVEVIAKLAKVYLCSNASLTKVIHPNVQHRVFSGKHPSGLVGTHMHYLCRPTIKEPVWYLNYQDVISIGMLFKSGVVWNERIISLAGPNIKTPRLLKVPIGCKVSEVTDKQLKNTKEDFTIAGSILNGWQAAEAYDYLGRYHHQICSLRQGLERPFMHYLVPGISRYSYLPIYLSCLDKKVVFPMTTSTNGSQRAMLSLGQFESIGSLDILPTQLLRSLVVGHQELAQNLGCLELEEEDLALFSFVCPSKYDYGAILRDNLEEIRKYAAT